MLTDQQEAMLDMEKSWYRYAGRKDTVIRERFGISSTRYYQVLNDLIDDPEVLAEEPQLVRRLQRLREQRRRARSARALGFDA
jgi:hypothetical protein